MLETEIIKSNIPIMWLDTAIIIKIAKIKNGMMENYPYKQELIDLYNTIIAKRKKKKLICPKGDQEEEIILGEEVIKESKTIQEQLSYGIRFLHRYQIRDIQLENVMRASIKGNKLTLNYKEAFFNDPINELMRKKEFIIMINSTISHEDIDKMKQNKFNIMNRWEELRKQKTAEHITYDQQLQTEYWGTHEYFSIRINQIMNKLDKFTLTSDDIIEYAHLYKLIDTWNDLSATSEGYAGLKEFLKSEYMKQVPYIDISSKLTATSITGESSIESGDSMDVNQLAAVIPYCNYIITDRKMKNRIIFRGIDKTYSTEIYCERDLEKLNQRLSLC